MLNPEIILSLFEAKGWYLYRANPHSKIPEAISAGKARSLDTSTFYHLVPAIAHDNSVDEAHDAIADAVERGAAPTYDDKVNKERVTGIYISTTEFVFVSKPNSFVFKLDSQETIENAIKFNLSNYKTYFFDSIDEIASWVTKHNFTPQAPSLLPSQLRWEYAHRDEDPTLISIYPSDASPILFRGQRRRFTPCVSTACRGFSIDVRALNELAEADQARLIANFIRTNWFVELLRQTPAVKWLKGQRIFMDEVAVAQHYGLPTGYIDLTQSFEVASFFACCEYDRETQSWNPASEAEGVVYVLDQRELPHGGIIKPINLQVFPRPSEQWAWTCELTLGDDFDKLPFVKKFLFKHNLESSKRILARFHNGQDLFPYDPLAKLAEEVVSSTILPLDVTRAIASDLINDPLGKPGVTVEEILSLLQGFGGVRLSPEAQIPDIETLNSALDSVWNQKKDSFFRGIGVRLVRTLKEKERPTI